MASAGDTAKTCSEAEAIAAVAAVGALVQQGVDAERTCIFVPHVTLRALNGDYYFNTAKAPYVRYVRFLGRDDSDMRWKYYKVEMELGAPYFNDRPPHVATTDDVKVPFGTTFPLGKRTEMLFPNKKPGGGGSKAAVLYEVVGLFADAAETKPAHICVYDGPLGPHVCF